MSSVAAAAVALRLHDDTSLLLLGLRRLQRARRGSWGARAGGSARLRLCDMRPHSCVIVSRCVGQEFSDDEQEMAAKVCTARIVPCV